MGRLWRVYLDIQIPLVVEMIGGVAEGCGEKDARADHEKIKPLSLCDGVQIEILEGRQDVEDVETVVHVGDPRQKICDEQHPCGQRTGPLGIAENSGEECPHG